MSEKPDQLPAPQEGALHVGASADGSEVLVWGPNIVLRFEPRAQLPQFINLLQDAQKKAIKQQDDLAVINVNDPLRPNWEDKANRLSDLPNAGHGDFKTERYRK